ncbi:MAG TPA: DUF4019 domain-containing protein [Dyella sp.]|uniref:DUF4019 domain-containing protein n=1 Tax=Dyella sp. TaxID=1869338 RepID=UPI002C0D2A38|nr:DUF4019 domain-containing protein [Dyella sp.]HUB89007.1 DUF4019 domain-containing protein [Dyella sp.]
MASQSSSTPRRIAAGALASAMLLGAGMAMAQNLDLDKAVSTAGKWAAQADAGKADAMWKASSPTMQKSVTQDNWTKYITNLRGAVGNESERTWVGVSKVDNPKDLPPGQYLNVIYATKFAKAMTVETVSLAKGSSGWQPIGYIVREANPNAAAANNGNAAPSDAPAQKAQPASGK